MSPVTLAAYGGDLEVFGRIRDGRAAQSPVILSEFDCALVLSYVTWLEAQTKVITSDDPEQFRREQPSVPTGPLDSKAVGPELDYAANGLLVQRAMHHLDEALPTGQRMRGELALQMLRRGTEGLAVWMRLRGYKV